MYEYSAKVLRVVDGDTCDLDIDLGRKVHIFERIRMYGINAPESTGKTVAAGKASKEWLREKVDGKTIRVQTILDKDEKFGRLLGLIFCPPESLTSVNVAMIAAQHAVAYDGGKR